MSGAWCSSATHSSTTPGVVVSAMRATPMGFARAVVTTLRTPRKVDVAARPRSLCLGNHQGASFLEICQHILIMPIHFSEAGPCRSLPGRLRSSSLNWNYSNSLVGKKTSTLASASLPGDVAWPSGRRGGRDIGIASIVVICEICMIPKRRASCSRLSGGPSEIGMPVRSPTRALLTCRAARRSEITFQIA